MKILIIDDEEYRHKHFSREYWGNVIFSVYTYSEAVEALESAAAPFDLICFDHDLGDFSEEGKELTGASIARYMAENGMKCKSVRVHSNNVNGAMNIISILNSGEVFNDAYYQPIALSDFTENYDKT